MIFINNLEGSLLEQVKKNSFDPCFFFSVRILLKCKSISNQDYRFNDHVCESDRKNLHPFIWREFFRIYKYGI